MAIRQAPLGQILLSEHDYSPRCGRTVAIVKVERAMFGWTEDLKGHFLRVPDVEVGEDAEVS